MNERLDEFFEKSKSVEQGYIIALFTDEVYIDDWNAGNMEKIKEKLRDRKESLLELRMFNAIKEIKLFRSDINADSEIRMRIIDDGNRAYEDYYDENQFLDIDTTESHKAGNIWNIQAIGGGRYNLPESVGGIKDLTLKVRHYISKYKTSGKAYVSDWRCVGFYKDENEEEARRLKSWEGGE